MLEELKIGAKCHATVPALKQGRSAKESADLSLTIGDWSVVVSCRVVGWGAAAQSSERS